MPASASRPAEPAAARHSAGGAGDVFLAAADTLTKHLASIYPVPVVVAVRYVVNVGLLALFLGPRFGSGLWATKRTWLVLARGLCLAGAALTMALALRLMPVGEAVAIVYLAPFGMMLLAGPLLGEKVSAIGWLGVALGFLGVILIARPGSGLNPLGVTFALINAGLSTFYHLLTRLLSRTESTVAMLFHTAWVGAVIFCVLAIPQLPAVAAAAPRYRPHGVARGVDDAGPCPVHRGLSRGARVAAGADQLSASAVGGWARLAGVRPHPRQLGAGRYAAGGGAGAMVAISSTAKDRKERAARAAAILPVAE